MPNNSFSIFNREKHSSAGVNDSLVLEIGKTHLATILTNPEDSTIKGFELFTFREDETAEFETLFSDIATDSQLLNHSYNKTNVYINHEYCLPVPVSKFNKDIAESYLEIAFGELTGFKTGYDQLAIKPDIINVYKAAETYSEILNRKYNKVLFNHTWSNVLRTLDKRLAILPSQFIYIQFYNTYFITAVYKNAELILIQSWEYDTPEDVLYYLINITERLELNRSAVSLQVSGMIDLEYKLFRELTHYFRQIVVEKVDQSHLQLDIGQHPLHYFTPFFNLTL